jgi:succinate dehydrogenase flavin-adding protein (antitoxin of CptAB toxin-antitoxin module)
MAGRIVAAPWTRWIGLGKTLYPAAGMSEPIEQRRKRLIHRSRYTGMKETDLLLGDFAMRHVPDFSAEDLERYERLLAEPDPDIYDWATGAQPVPIEHDHRVMKLLQNFGFIR